MRKLLFCVVSFSMLLGSAMTVPAALSDQVVHYRISARLDTKAKAVIGSETLTWRNTSGDNVGELRFHLYLNAFKNEKSTFIRESGGRLRGDTLEKGKWGYIDVQDIRLASGFDLKPSLKFLHPDDNNADDQTVMSVTLPQPVAPGQSVDLKISFYSKLPQVFARSGYFGDFYMVGQWFPKIGVYEHPGMRYATQGQWNCHQYHAMSEFYADYGSYQVDITVPSNYVVGATGVQQSHLSNPDGTTTYTFSQEDVHDFAWTADPTFIRVERTFKADQMVSSKELEDVAKLVDRPVDEVRLQDVKMILLIHPEHAAQIDRHFRAVENGLKYFGLWYGKYPYPTITVVDPAYHADGAAGMEYPTLFTGGTSWLPDPPPGEVEGVVIHEFGHQYWYGMVGSNEFEESWLDEGFNTYSTGRVIDTAYGPQSYKLNVMGIPVTWLISALKFDNDALNRGITLSSTRRDFIVRNAWDYYDESSYATNSYMRTAATLRTLQHVVGDKTFAKIMRTYFERWRFKHPSTKDFRAVVDEVAGRDMGWFFDQFVYSSDVLDYAVESVKSTKVRPGLGIFDEPSGKHYEITSDQRERLEKNAKDKKEQDMYESVVTVRRLGGVIAPMDVLVAFENGEQFRTTFDGQYRWARYRFVKPSKILYAQLDPDHHYLLDANFSNNSQVLEGHRGAAVKWGSKCLFWIQNFLMALMSLV
ncbi:MAG: M1 family metallopeptidase [Acidobacteriia bacterium]|nr:M1 family metallopeptidase [Terriglobia bacterium]